jgi:ABC-type multidrug transport system fused ATPase/permease subunit
MLAVLRKLNLHTTGAGEPRNLGDYVDVGGKNFSAGERQRLCFARAILARPQLLVLDEATANLDVETESKMAELLAELKSQCTTLVVSHRPGILAHADVIWDLNELKGVAKSVT